MAIDLSSPLTIGLNLLMAAALTRSVLVVWNARQDVGLLAFATVFAGAVLPP